MDQEFCNNNVRIKEYIKLILLGKGEAGVNLKKQNYYDTYFSLLSDVEKQSALKIDNITVPSLILEIDKLIFAKCENLFLKVKDDYDFIKDIVSESTLKTIKQVKKDSTELNNKLNNFFNNTATIKRASDNLKSFNDNKKRKCIDETKAILSKESKYRDLPSLEALIVTNYKDVIQILEITVNEIKTCSNKALLLCIILYVMIVFSDLNDGPLLEIVKSNDVFINDAAMVEIFSKKTTLDSRQNIAVQRFTKFKKPGDKVSFLFHGVGTGKTMTSLSIAISNLTKKNIQGEQDFSPFKVLVIAPSGIFRGAFIDDCLNLGIYVNNVVIQNISGSVLRIESFNGLIKHSKNPEKLYEIEFTGYDYDNLFHTNGGLTYFNDQNYDFLICDEAHRLLTNRLPSTNRENSYTRYDLEENERGGIKIVTMEGDQSLVRNVITDNTFLEFVSKFKQSVFLTGTPIQSSADDIIDIAFFLNSPNLNKSNEQKFIKDAISSGRQTAIFKPIDSLSYFLSGNFTVQCKVAVTSILTGLVSALDLIDKGVSKFTFIPYLNGGAPEKINDGNKLILYKKEIDNIVTIITDKPNISGLIALFESNLVPSLIHKIDPSDKISTHNNIDGLIYGNIFFLILINKSIKPGEHPDVTELKGGTTGMEKVINSFSLLGNLLSGLIKNLVNTIKTAGSNKENAIKLFVLSATTSISAYQYIFAAELKTTAAALAQVLLATKAAAAAAPAAAAAAAQAAAAAAVVPSWVSWTAAQPLGVMAEKLGIFIKVCKGLVSPFKSWLESCFEIDYDNLLKHTFPYVSVYNYDFNNYAIDKDEFYKDIESPESGKNLFISMVNTKGNKSSFPVRNIIQFLIPFTEDQSKKINTETRRLSSDPKKLNDIIDNINNIGCIIEDGNKDMLKGSYNINDFAALLAARADFLDTREQIAPSDKFKNKVTRINIPDNLGEAIKTATKNNRELTGNHYIQTDEINKIMRQAVANRKNLDESDPSYMNDDSVRYVSILSQLMNIKCGLLYHDYGYGLHPHYVKIDNKYEYYLPLIYPATSEIMYSFCNFLKKFNKKYIWMNSDKPDDVVKNFKYGQTLTFPIGSGHDEHPICVIISPDHTEGFSFIYNPSILIPALCKTAGDQEQVNGRILRKYGNDTHNKKSYEKTIYQYSGGSDDDLAHATTFQILYGIDEKHKIVGSKPTLITSNTGVNRYFFRPFQQFQKTTTQNFINAIPNNVLRTWANQTINAEVGVMRGRNLPEAQRNARIESLIGRYQNSYPSEEFHMILLYNVALISKTYFGKLVEMENKSYKNQRIKPGDSELIGSSAGKNLFYCRYKPINRILCNIEEREREGNKREEENNVDLVQEMVDEAPWRSVKSVKKANSAPLPGRNRSVRLRHSLGVRARSLGSIKKSLRLSAKTRLENTNDSIWKSVKGVKTWKSVKHKGGRKTRKNIRKY
uniref:Helicase ATP-binding domain-containing protein n=1 Tax=viral metagenome TaxID=1070528 RepID=A0A6C0L7U7_9ZZZZ